MENPSKSDQLYRYIDSHRSN